MLQEGYSNPQTAHTATVQVIREVHGEKASPRLVWEVSSEDQGQAQQNQGMFEV